MLLSRLEPAGRTLFVLRDGTWFLALQSLKFHPATNYCARPFSRMLDADESTVWTLAASCRWGQIVA